MSEAAEEDPLNSAFAHERDRVMSQFNSPNFAGQHGQTENLIDSRST